MSGTATIESVEERRRRLVTESAALREQLTTHLAEFERAGAWVDKGYELVCSARGVWPLLAALAGVIFMRKDRNRWLSLFKKAWSFWRVVRQTGDLWVRSSSRGAPGRS